MKRLLPTIALLGVTAPALAERVVEIADQDEAALMRTLCRTQVDGRSVRIRLAPNGYYDLHRLFRNDYIASSKFIPAQLGSCAVILGEYGATALLFPGIVIDTTVTIEGRGAEIRIPSTYYPRNSGTLKLEKLDLIGDTSAPLFTHSGPLPPKPLFSNSGTLSLQGVSISGVIVRGCTAEYSEPALLLDNQGEARFENVSLHSNQFAHDEDSTFDDCRPVGIANSGDLSMNNVTMIAYEPSAVRNVGHGTATVANSLAAPFKGSCDIPVHSLGGNVLTRQPGECFELHRTDQVEDVRFDTVLHTTPRRTMWTVLGSTGIDEAGTGEVDCAETDLRGYLRTDGQCDAGALERNAVPPVSVESDGMWVDSANDGHYLLINHVEQGGRTIVYWQTFGADGSPRWYYGFATPERNQLTVELFENTGVRFADGRISGELRGNVVGSIQIELIDCGTMTVDYELPGDAGQFSMRPLTRLAGRECHTAPGL